MLKFEVIDGTPAPDTPTERVRKRLRDSNPGYLLACHRCGGREVIEARIGMLVRNGKPTGGTKTYLCAACFMRGERVLLK